MSEPDPQRFGTYRVDDRIGAGGMGIVYRAFDDALQRPVALKTLLPALAADPEFVARFKREAQSAAALNHPNITQIYSIGQEGPVPYFAMELIRGQSLEQMVRDAGALEPMKAAGFVLQAARGLRHAAQKDLIHRDVKPSNLMLSEDGVIKITDFGLAKAARAETRLTATGEVLGSPGYISPEQAQGQALDARSDIYSLGATFYQLVTGKLPFEAPTPVAMIVKHLNEPLRSPRILNPQVPYPIAACIQKMMAKRPHERFQDYDALVRELERALATAPPVATTAPVPGTTAMAGGAAGAAAAPSATWVGQTGIERRPRPRRGQEDGAPAVSEEGSRSSWLPVFLAVMIGALIVAALVHHRQSTAQARSSAGMAAGEITSQGTLTVGGDEAVSEGVRTRFKSAERFNRRLRARSPANLVFDKHDHEILEDGTLRVYGQVTNRGGSPAAHARVRVQILTDAGAVAIKGEATLDPELVAPGGSATYSLPLDYEGPVGTIQAELAWVE